jgi:hypothetical protein
MEEHVGKAIDEEVAAAERRALAQVGGSATRLAEELRKQGTDLETWKRDLRRGHVVRWYVQQRLNPKTVVTRRMMWDYYRAHPEEFRKAGRRCSRRGAPSPPAPKDGQRRPPAWRRPRPAPSTRPLPNWRGKPLRTPRRPAAGPWPKAVACGR